MGAYCKQRLFAAVMCCNLRAKLSLLASPIQPWGVDVSIIQKKRKLKLGEPKQSHTMSRKRLFFFFFQPYLPNINLHCLHRNRINICRHSRLQYKKKVDAIKKKKLQKILEGSDDDSEIRWVTISSHIIADTNCLTGTILLPSSRMPVKGSIEWRMVQSILTLTN